MKFSVAAATLALLSYPSTVAASGFSCSITAEYKVGKNVAEPTADEQAQGGAALMAAFNSVHKDVDDKIMNSLTVTSFSYPEDDAAASTLRSTGSQTRYRRGIFGGDGDGGCNLCPDDDDDAVDYMTMTKDDKELTYILDSKRGLWQTTWCKDLKGMGGAYEGAKACKIEATCTHSAFEGIQITYNEK